MKFFTEVVGIACICRVDYYEPGERGIINSASLAPVEPEDFEFTILDNSGNEWPRLNSIAHNTASAYRKILSDFHEVQEEY